MAKARAIHKRRRAVRNIRKITRTMQLIATSKYQQSLNRATAGRPYAYGIADLVQKIAAAAGEHAEHPLLHVNRDAGRGAILLLTSNRGLCGGYNALLLRAAQARLRTGDGDGSETDLHVVGKKGVNYFTFLRRAMAQKYTKVGDTPRFADIEPIAEGFIEDYQSRRVDWIDIVYMKFVSAGRQEPTCARLLPFHPMPAADPAAEPEGPAVAFDFTPPAAELLRELLPAAVKATVYQYFLDAMVSENVARMVAMKAATDAAGDMIRSLSRQFNRARQTQITMELLDIVGGAAAIS